MIGKLPESAGMNLGPQLDKFEAEFGFHGAPWCGIFVGHALQAAGLKVPHTVASVAVILDLARSGDGPFQKGILPVSAIRPGDLVTFGGTEHVAIVTHVDAQGIHTIAGNTGQSNVSETTYSPSSVTGVVATAEASGIAPRAGLAGRRRGVPPEPEPAAGAAGVARPWVARCAGRCRGAPRPMHRPPSLKHNRGPRRSRRSSDTGGRTATRSSSWPPSSPPRARRCSTSAARRRQPARQPAAAAPARGARSAAGARSGRGQLGRRWRRTGGAISVSSSLLTRGQEKFAAGWRS